MTRFVVFLGFFSLLLVLGLIASAVLMQLGILRGLGHANLGWGSGLVIVAYLVLSLRLLLRNANASKAV